MTSTPASALWTIPAAAASRTVLPHFELKQISPHGAVFRSNRPCEPGTSFAFGIHLPAARQNRLMDLEAIVVDCRAADDGISLGWEVTLIFDSVTPAQSTALRAASRIRLPHGDSSFFNCDPMAGPGLN